MSHHRRAFVSKLIVLAAVFLLGATAAQAGALVYGTAAWTNKDLSLREGPGNRYDVIGGVTGEIRIRVERCTRRWCYIRGDEGSGWVTIDHLSFGQAPGYFLDGPKLHYPSGGAGQVCFYSGKHYTGTAYCGRAGNVVADLVVYELDNHFASVSISGGVSVTVCRDRNFSSYCERVIESQPVLDRFLVNNVSSYRVH